MGINRFLNDQLKVDVINYKIKLHNGFNLQAQKQHIHVIKLSKSRLHRLKKIKEQTIVIQILSDSLTPFKYAKKYLKFYLDAKKYYIRAMGHDIYSPILKPMINKILNFLS